MEVGANRKAVLKVLQFDTRTLLFATALAGVGVLWLHDRQKLEERLAAIEMRYRPFAGSPWSPNQASGSPDCPSQGQHRTSWAPANILGEEWLELTYAKAIKPSSIEVYENSGPGRITKITCFDQSGAEQTLWQGTDPTSTTELGGISTFHFSKPLLTDRIRVYLDGKAGKGWPQIDAVGLHYGMFDNVIWATNASASSTYADVMTGRYQSAMQSSR